jgi:ABC-type uncharacterized transport system involved in gliding motility auxiliary subunit
MKFDLSNSIKTTFHKKKFRYGGYATLVTAVVVTMLILLNLIVDQFDFTLDLTRNRLFSLSEQTFGVLDALEHEIDVIALNEPGAENPVAMQIIEQYTSRSRYINFSTIDPVRQPHRVMRYQEDGTTLAQGSIIVENRDLNRFKVISAHELINFRFDAQQQPIAESLAVEQRLTGAIIYTTTEELPVVYVLTGHDQAPIPFEIREQMELENFRIEEINLMTTESVPEDAHALLVISPKRDLTETEEQKLREYLERQGRAIFLMDIMPQRLPRFEAIFQSYGVELNRLLVVEEDDQMHVGNPLWLVPNMEAHDIMTPLRTADMRMLIPVSQSIDIMDVRRRTLKIEPLLVTSEMAWGKTNLESQTLEREEGDIEGPFNIGVAVTDEVFMDNQKKTTKILLLANAGFLSSEISSQVPGNANFLLNSLNWIQDREEAISIRPRSLATPRLNMNWQQQLMLAGVAVILIPLLILGSGLFVWMKRRHL